MSEGTYELLECPECHKAGVVIVVPAGVNEKVRAGEALSSEEFTPYCFSCHSAFSLALVGAMRRSLFP